MQQVFDYHQAFSRNLGWITESEQKTLRGARIAIAGLGGVGGSHLLALARLGVGAFNISDFDKFEIVNMNRQAGASVSHLGQPKIEVMARMARDVNPELDLRSFPEGVNKNNVDAFLDGVDLYADSLDFFAFDARRMMFAACEARGIPTVSVGPLGMGAAMICFLPGGMSFEQYFRWEGQTEEEMALRFLVGLAPTMLQTSYLVDTSRVNLSERRGPSTPMGCELCTGVAATEVLKILLRRGRVYAAPYTVQYDAYLNKLSRTWRPGGNANPLQRLVLSVTRRRLAKMRAAAAASAALQPR